MSATREVWAYLILKVMHLIYEQDDTFSNKSFEESRDQIEERINKWQLQDFNKFIIEEFPINQETTLTVDERQLDLSLAK